MVKWYTVKFEIWDTDEDIVQTKEIKLRDFEFSQVVDLAEKISGDYG